MDATQIPPTPSSDAPDLPPGTYEFIDSKKKKNWKKTIEITLVLVITSVPLILSLFKIDYSIQRAYEAINPASLGISPSYQNWGSVFTNTKKFIQSATQTISKPEAKTEQASSTPTTAQVPSHTPSPTQIPTSTTNYTQVEPSSTPTTVHEPTDVPTPTDTPMPQPTDTPVPDQGQQTDPAILACIDKNYNSKCSYYSNGQKFEGRCRITYSGNFKCINSD